MINLYELKATKEKLVRNYSEDHDWEISYQKYYDFLTKDFYDFLIGKIDGYVKSLFGVELVVSIEPDTIPFITSFVNFYYLGTIQPIYGDDNGSLVIRFGNVSVRDAITSYYNELQTLERTMKTPREMNEDLANFSQNNKDWLTKKRFLENSLSSTMEEPISDEYYNFLNNKFHNAFAFVKSPYKKHEHINFRTNNYETFELIRIFLTDYQLGDCIYVDNTVAIDLFADTSQMSNAYYMEMQRLAYLHDEDNNLGRK